jgi:hypothetical protein
MMFELLRQLLGVHRQDPAGFREVLPILKAILHSDALTEIVRATKSPVDDLVLQVLRALIPKE